MTASHEVTLIEHVLWHCEIVYNLNSMQQALERARLDGFLDANNRLTSVGRSIAEVMVQDFKGSEQQIGQTIKEKPVFFLSPITSQFEST